MRFLLIVGLSFIPALAIASSSETVSPGAPGGGTIPENTDRRVEPLVDPARGPEVDSTYGARVMATVKPRPREEVGPEPQVALPK